MRDNAKRISEKEAAIEAEMSLENYRELKRRIKDLDDPVRYVVATSLFREQARRKNRWQIFLNVSDETWCNCLDTATVFKRRHYAEAILEAYNKGKPNENVDTKGFRSDFIVKITTKNKKRRILRYFDRPERDIKDGKDKFLATLAKVPDRDPE